MNIVAVVCPLLLAGVLVLIPTICGPGDPPSVGPADPHEHVDRRCVRRARHRGPARQRPRRRDAAVHPDDPAPRWRHGGARPGEPDGQHPSEQGHAGSARATRGGFAGGGHGARTRPRGERNAAALRGASAVGVRRGRRWVRGAGRARCDRARQRGVRADGRHRSCDDRRPTLVSAGRLRRRSRRVVRAAARLRAMRRSSGTKASPCTSSRGSRVFPPIRRDGSCWPATSRRRRSPTRRSARSSSSCRTATRTGPGSSAGRTRPSSRNGTGSHATCTTDRSRGSPQLRSRWRPRCS